MKKILLLLYSLFSLIFIIYLSLPNLSFPEPASDFKQSTEPADSETLERRAYFTDFTRDEVLSYYQERFKLTFMGFEIPSFKLIYPPEDAYPIIRDQTRSTHLEEIVYPFRESFFVNEFVPKQAKDDIWYKGVHYEQKITVKIKQSSIGVRLFVGIITVFLGWFVLFEFQNKLKNYIVILKGLKWPFFWS